MKRLKSMDELKDFRKKCIENFSGSEKIRIIVGMATCGIAAGAGEVFDSIAGEVLKLGLGDRVTVVRSGCMGACHSEPTVEIAIPGEESVLYGNIDSQRAKVLVKNHVMRNEIVTELVLEKAYDTIS